MSQVPCGSGAKIHWSDQDFEAGERRGKPRDLNVFSFLGKLFQRSSDSRGLVLLLLSLLEGREKRLILRDPRNSSSSKIIPFITPKPPQLLLFFAYI